MIHVKLQSRILDNKTSFIMFIPLFIWLFVLLGTLFTMFATNFYVLVPVMGVEFLCIIPIFLLCQSRVNKAFKTLDDQSYEADLEVKDHKLYYGKLELKAKYDKRFHTVSLQHEMVSGKYHTKALSFWSIVCLEDLDVFIKLCEFYHVPIKGSHYLHHKDL